MDVQSVIHDVFASGMLARYIRDFEYRSIQEQMAHAIAQSWYDQTHVVIEAGTGTGKTFGYLLPAALFALYEDVKVAIVTETKALQQQLILKDLPVVASLVEELTDSSLEYALCLGSNNYPCLRRLQHAIDTGSFDKRFVADIHYLHALLKKDHTITRFDVQVADAVWNAICRESELCTMHKCKYRNKCSYMEARKQWQQANILVMNHYLFFSNIAASKSLVPDCRGVVFDEAHSLERIASSQLGFIINIEALKETLEYIIHRKKGSSLIERWLPYALHQEAIEIFDNALRQLQVCKSICNNILQELQTLRLRNPLKECLPLLKALEEILGLFEKVEAEKLEEDWRCEFEYQKSIIMNTCNNLGMIVFMDDDSYVYWLEKEKSREGTLCMCGQPLDVACIIHKEVVEYYNHLAFVSATLTVNNSFDYFIRSIGLTKATSLILPSPFDFAAQSVLFIDRDNVDPSEETFIDNAAEKIKTIINIVQGRCLVLFTSYSMLTKIYEKLYDAIPYTIFSQHLMNATAALQEYIGCDNAVLFGTHSFWQGVDLPGDLARAVIIMKLPFETPDNPIVGAKIEKIQKEGGNPFMSYQLPYAVLLLKQGYGRLIRKSSDKGVIAILDPRIVTKSYGRIFLASLPNSKKVYSLEELEEAYRNL
ncbi:MAG: DEAD/DEAH box helicase family protein, partial [Spirochaetes bacterium]|nr:DEAD/DEAH box helicase family protein [Spirochaetota bacterium]